jgi:hypothetical protein
MPFRCTVDKSGLVFPSMQAAARWNAWREDHEGAHIRIEEEKPTRSTSQNRYYWTYLDIIEKETGNNATDLHEFFKRKLLPPVFKNIMGEEMKLPASTTDLNKADFTMYLDKICALTGVPLPDPVAAGYLPN